MLNRENSSPSISVVIPVYNEELVVDELYLRLNNVLNQIGRSYQIIFVDDGSNDNTFVRLKRIQELDSTIKLIKLRCNFGQTPALAAGFDYAEGEVIIAMDGDLQHSPEDIPKFINKMDEGYDIVSGWREHRKDPFLTRRLPSKIANWIMKKLSGIPLHDFGTTFKAYKREIIKEINLYGQFHRFIPVLASRIGVKIAEIPIENSKQKHRGSNYTLSRTITVFFDLIRLSFLQKYTSRPLQLFGTIGMTIAITGFLIASYLAGKKILLGISLMVIHGPLLLLSILLMIIGLQILIFGLLAELIVRFFYESKVSQIYSIESIHSTAMEPNNNGKTVNNQCRRFWAFKKC